MDVTLSKTDDIGTLYSLNYARVSEKCENKNSSLSRSFLYHDYFNLYEKRICAWEIVFYLFTDE